MNTDKKSKKKRRSSVSEIEFVDKIIFGIQDLWKELDISYDDFIRTTQPRHTKAVQKISKISGQWRYLPR